MVKNMLWKKLRWWSYQKERNKMPLTKLEFLLPFNIQTSLPTRKLSLRMQPQAYALSWSTLMVVIWWNSSVVTREKLLTLPKRKYGITSYKLFEESKRFMISKFVTEISSVPTYSWPRTVSLSLETWMCLKLQRRECCIRRQAPHTMQAQKFGRTSLMITEAIYGHWVASYMRWSLSTHPLEHRTWMACITRSSGECMIPYPLSTASIYKWWSGLAFKFLKFQDRLAIKSYKCLGFWITCLELLKLLISRSISRMRTYFALSRSQRFWVRSLKGYLSRSINWKEWTVSLLNE